MNDIISSSSDFQSGKRKTKELNLAICGLARNVEHSIGNLLQKFEELKDYFSNVYIVIVENDSTDNTKAILNDWSSKNSKHFFISEDINLNPVSEGPFSDLRISLMSNFRNKYLKKIREIQELNYVMMIDLDIYNFSVKEVIETFNHKENWDVVSANGKNLVPQFAFPVFFDVFALKEIGNSPVMRYIDIAPLQRKFNELCKKNRWIKVESGFNGLAIYNADCFKSDLVYMAKKSESNEIPVLCEHISFNLDLLKIGFSRQFVNPNLHVKYLKISFQIFYSNFYKHLKFRVGTMYNYFFRR